MKMKGGPSRAYRWLRAMAATGLIMWLPPLPVAGAQPPGTWRATGNMSNAHFGGQTATLLDNGMVLVSGGLGDSGDSSVASCELYDPQTGRWQATGPMHTPRSSHTATLLRNGKVLVTGGFDQTVCFPSCGVPVVATAEVYDPDTGTWSITATMASPRAQHTATRLPDDRVLVTGGVSQTTLLASAEIYDPQVGVWGPAASMIALRAGHIVSLLRNGMVLVAGGFGNGTDVVRTAELYDPSTDTWTATNSLTTDRVYHTATELTDGTVLVVGGFGSFDPSSSPTFVSLASTEIYDPSRGSWSATGSMSVGRSFHTVTRLRNGTVLATGGEDYDTNALQSAEIYDRKNGVWTATGSMTTHRTSHTASLLRNGRVLVAGGWFSGNALVAAELYKQ